MLAVVLSTRAALDLVNDSLARHTACGHPRVLDRPISPHANLVTPEGLAELDAALASARTAYAAAQVAGDVQADRTAMAKAAGDLPYYTARRASAQLMDRSSGVVVFG